MPLGAVRVVKIQDLWLASVGLPVTALGLCNGDAQSSEAALGDTPPLAHLEAQHGHSLALAKLLTRSLEPRYADGQGPFSEP